MDNERTDRRSSLPYAGSALRDRYIEACSPASRSPLQQTLKALRLARCLVTEAQFSVQATNMHGALMHRYLWGTAKSHTMAMEVVAPEGTNGVLEFLVRSAALSRCVDIAL